MISLTTYAYMLRTHDWHYQRSDDRGAYQRGQDQRIQLNRHLKDSTDHARLFNMAFNKFATI